MLLTYLHPLSAAVALLFLAYVGSLGLRARSQPRRRRALLAEHARWAPIMFVLMLAMWPAGLATTWALRPDLELAASTHFRLGSLLVGALAGGYVTSRYLRQPALREAHPWFGIAAMLTAAAQVFFGLQITP